MPFLPPNQQCQSTEGIRWYTIKWCIIISSFLLVVFQVNVAQPVLPRSSSLHVFRIELPVICDTRCLVSLSPSQQCLGAAICLWNGVVYNICCVLTKCMAPNFRGKFFQKTASDWKIFVYDIFEAAQTMISVSHPVCITMLYLVYIV